MKNLRTILPLAIALLIFTSCDNEQVSKKDEVEPPFSEIAALSSNPKIREVILNRYSSSFNARVTSNFGELFYESAEIGYSNVSNSIALVIPFGDEVSSLVVLGDQDGAIYEEFIASITKNSDLSSEVKYYDTEGNPMISFSVINGKIKNIVSNNISGRVADWDSCTTCAVTSCGSDGGCTILCGLTGPWCLTAIALACIDSDLAC